MKGPFPLEPAVIDREVRSRPGAYLLIGSDEAFLYAGRADHNLTVQLKTHVGHAATTFCIQPTDTPREAYEIECLWYHTYRLPWNTGHPASPQGKRWTCPLCWIFNRPHAAPRPAKNGAAHSTI